MLIVFEKIFNHQDNEFIKISFTNLKRFKACYAGL